MKHEEVDEIIACLPKGKTPFRYFKDRYAFLLLGMAAGGGTRIASIRSSRFGQLLCKPTVRSHIALAGDGTVSSDFMNYFAPLEQETYLLTLGRWGTANRTHWNRSIHQSCRRGETLVLQVNFSNRHDREYARLSKRAGEFEFNWNGHPVSKARRTLGWCRMDISLDSGEALIEEIQCDWLGNVLSELKWYESLSREYCDTKVGERYRSVYADLQRYFEKALRNHVHMWHEAILSAALWFLANELGVRSVFYHSWECGNVLKGQRNGCQPPRSLYTDIPQKFCFEPTGTSPRFLPEKYLRRVLKRRTPLKFYLHEF